LVKNFSLSTAYSSLATAVSWDGRDDFGKLLSSGIYYCRLTQGNYTEKGNFYSPIYPVLKATSSNQHILSFGLLWI